MSDLDALTREVDDQAACKIELRSKWLDLEEINLANRNVGGLPSGSEHKRLAEIVLDEIVQIASQNR